MNSLDSMTRQPVLSPLKGLLLGVAVEGHRQVCGGGCWWELPVWLLHVTPDGLQPLTGAGVQQ
jgi:hypothetical protein